MNPYELQVVAARHIAYATMLKAIAPADDPEQRDRGAVSIEQVLWYAAAAVAVAVVAGIIWGQVRDTANNVSPAIPAAP